MPPPHQALQITHPLLQQLRLFFDSRGGGTLANGYLDPGYNCYAKAFVTVYLARLQGIAADHCAGEGFMVWSRGPHTIGLPIVPHAWAGLRTGRVIDLSIGDVDHHRYFTTGHVPLEGLRPIPSIATAVTAEFAAIREKVPALGTGSYLFYRVQKSRPFKFDDLLRAETAVKSPPTRALLAQYRDDMLARIILHLHRVGTGDRAPVTGTQAEAWAELAKGKIDALKQLEVIWRLAWRGRAAPPRDDMLKLSWNRQLSQLGEVLD